MFRQLAGVPTWLIVVVLALMLLLAGSGVMAQGPHPDTDAEITAAVQRALRAERSLEHADIRVETTDGAVGLRGFARTMEDIAAASRVAFKVRGVRGVTNAIRVAT